MNESTTGNILQWETASDAIEDCIFILDTDMNVIYANKAARSFLKKEIEELIGKHCWELVHGTTRPPDFCPMDKMLKSKKRESATIELAGKFFKITVDPVFDEHGSFKGAIHILRDIDESERKSILIEESAEKYRNLVATMSDVTFTLDFDGNVIDTTPSMNRITGLSREETIGKRFSEFVHPDDIQKAEEEFMRAIRGIGRPLEIRVTALDGTLRWVRINALLIMRNGEPEYLLCVLSDITERKQSELLLKECDIRFKKLSFNLPGMIYQFMRRPDGTYCVPFTSDGVKDVFGCSPEDVREDFSPISKVILPEDLKGVVDSIEYSAKNHTAWQYEYRVQVPGQLVKWMSGVSNPEELTDGSIIWHGYNADCTDRKRMEELLQENEEKYRMLLESSTEGIVVTQEGIILLVNPTVSTITGFSEQELISKPFSSFIHPDDLAMVLERYQKRLRGEATPSRYATRLLSKDGAVKWVEIAAVLIEWEGRPATMGFVTDITARKHTEYKLSESEKKYRLLVDSASEAIIVAQDGMIRLVNPTVLKMTGFSEQELISKPFLSFIHPDDLAMVVERYQKRLRGESVQDRYSFRVLTKDGRTRWAEIGVVMIEWEERPAILNFLTDITESKYFELELMNKTAEAVERSYELSAMNKVSEALLSYHNDDMYPNILQILKEATGSRYGVFGYLDDNGSLVIPSMTNTVWENCQISSRTSALPRERLVDCSWSIAIQEKRIILMNQPTTSAPNGNIQIARHISVPIVENNEIIGLIQVANKDSDYTEKDLKLINAASKLIAPVLSARLVKNRQEEELRIYRENLEKIVADRTSELRLSNKELDSFVYSVSHDLRAPLRSIDGFSQAVMEDYADKLDAQGQDYLNLIRDSTQRMGKLIDEMLMLSRISKAELKPDSVNLSVIADNISKELKESEPRRKVDFVIEPQIEVKGDRDLLRILMENLIGNAWKFTSKHESARIEIGRGNGIEGGSIYVKDDGAGFDMKYADKLFTPFQRLHTTSEFPGTGVGLATIQRILNKHGGRIWAEGAVEKGAVFHFTLGSEERIHAKVMK
jgi:PAS domain S-box-containing protein